MLGRAMRIGFSATTTTTTTTTTATIGRFLLSTCLLTVHHHFHPLSPRVQAFSMATVGTMTTTTTAAIHTSRRRRTTTTVALAATNQNEPSSLAVPVTPSPQKPTVQKRRRVSSPTKTKSTTVSSNSKSKTPPIATGQLTSTLVSAINPDQPYIDLKIPPGELRPSATLTTGQCFHWKAVQQDTDTDPSEETQDVLASTDLVPTKKQSAWGAHDATEWVGTIRMTDGLSVVLAIRETPSTTLFRPLTTNVSNERLFAFLYDYFRLASNDDDDSSSSLTKLYQEWSKADERLAIIAKCIPGVRIIEQDPFECLLSFICSSNNNIPRITKMLSAIRANYGDHLLTIGNDLEFYSFPSLEQLSAKATDEDLRTKCGLGYRSKYILETLKVLQSKKQTEKGGVGGGEAYLHGLRDVSDPRIVQEKLCEFCGVGRKVADCVALFSLRQDDAIPVDVHVWNIARRDFCDPSNENDDLLANANKSLTPATYWKVGDLFRSRFQEKAGWAHSLLFVAELPSFRPVLPQELVDEMDRFAQDEKAKKEQEKKKNEQKKTTKQKATTKPAKGKVKGRTTKAKTKSVD